jgi:hypothetical protein
MRLFLKGSECVEAIWRGEQPEPPLAWLPDEPTEIEIRSKKWQQTTARRLCRWDLDNWSNQREDSWPYPRTAI